jgi:hypothetical protein
MERIPLGCLCSIACQGFLNSSFVDSNTAKRAVDPKVNRNFSCPYSPISCGLCHWDREDCRTS